MVAEDHVIALKGPPGSGGRLPAAAVGRMLFHVESLVAASVRMGFRHSSQIKGRPPQWLSRAYDVRFRDVDREDDETTLLLFEAPRFGEAAEEVYQQGQLFEVPPDRNATGFDLLGDMLADVANQVVESERFDPPLLQHLSRFGPDKFRRGIESISVRGHRLGDNGSHVISQRTAQLADSLRRRTPAQSRARVAGKLDMIRSSDNVFELVLADGDRVRGVWRGGGSSMLGDMWEKQVVIEGLATFRPSGSLLRVDAEGMEGATDADQFFSKLPSPTGRPLDRQGLRRTQTASTGMNAVYGRWPGDESEEHILAALKELG